jgi:hypothetical protein
MPYQPIRTRDDAGERLVAGVTREDHWLEFKGEPFANDPDGRRKCLRAVAQFANASGGTVMIGATSTGEVLDAFASVPNPDEHVRWIDDLVKGNLEPVPGIEPVVIMLSTGTVLVALNVPPAQTLIGHRIGEAYEFPVRAAASRRYLRVAEMEARMQARERLQRLRLERIAPNDTVGIDAMLRTPELSHNNWHVEAVDDDVVTLRHGSMKTAVPLGTWNRCIEPASRRRIGWCRCPAISPNPSIGSLSK